MLFYLTTLDLVRFLIEDPPSKKDGEHDKDFLIALDSQKDANYLCQCYEMNCLNGSLYDVYIAKKLTKELQDSLDQKYKTKDARAKKFVMGHFLDYKMVDTKMVINQVQKFQVILHEIQTERNDLSQAFQVAIVIEKFPPTSKDFNNYLKHK